MLRAIWISILIFGITLTSVVSYVFYQINKNIQNSIPAYEQTINFPVYPSLNLQGKSSKEIKKIKRGEFLVKAGDCITCHTNTLENGKVFAGGLVIPTPYGTIYSSNITPDKNTGIGRWQDSTFIKAMREGIRPDHSYYYPAFPFLYFNKVTTEDLIAIKAYLNEIPAVEQKNRKNNMIWPFNWRFLQIGWRILFFRNTGGTYQNNPQRSPEWNEGAYLVEGLGHCGMCHTPSYYLFNKNLILAAPIQKYNLSGAYAQGYLAPDITRSALDDVPDDELLKTFMDYKLIGGGTLHGPMVEAVHNSLAYLSKNDLLAIVHYLKNTQSATMPVPILKNKNLGKVVYDLHCSVCHNPGVNGAPKLDDNQNWKPLIKSGIDKLYRIAIEGNASMPPKGGCIDCKDEEIKAAVDYLVQPHK